jgi:hypothetical protein
MVHEYLAEHAGRMAPVVASFAPDVRVLGRPLNSGMSFATKVLNLLHEAADAVTVGYTVTTPTGSKSSFTKTLSVSKVMAWFKSLFEGTYNYKPKGDPDDPTMFRVDYFYGKDPNAMGHTQGGGSLSQLRGQPRSETAILAYLKRLHPGCEIQIQSLDFE